MGRTTETFTIAGVGTTNTSTALTAPAGSFSEEDLGRTITGAGIPAGATLVAPIAANGSAATLSAAATATASVTVTIGPGDPAKLGFIGWSPETDAESESYKINSGVTPPDRVTSPGQRQSIQRSR